MSLSDRRRSLGKIVSVTADRFVVELHAGTDSFTLVGYDAQHYVARIGSFVLIPVQSEYVVAEIVGLRDRDAQGKPAATAAIEDSHGLHSSKFLDLVPVGTVPFRTDEKFRFGVSVFPPLYSDVVYAETRDLDRILDVTPTGPRAVSPATGTPPTVATSVAIGTSVVFEDYTVRVKLNEFFGGHAAVLGNTGSGKSCTVAAILQSVFTKPDEYAARGASFVFFDTNGEYRRAFSQLPEPIRREYSYLDDHMSTPFSQADPLESVFRFRLPHWFLTAEEWELLLRASEKAQRPILRTALGLATMFAKKGAELENLKNHILAKCFLMLLQAGESLTSSAERIRATLASFSTQRFNQSSLGPVLANNFGKFTAPGNANGERLYRALGESVMDDAIIPDYQNLPFDFADLGEALELAILYEESHGNRQIRDYSSSLLTRFKSIRDRSEFSFLRMKPQELESHERTKDAFVDKLLGLAKDDPPSVKSQITILDMNGVEDEIVEVISAVVTRLLFERLRMSEPRNALPVNLVLEEAHRYISPSPTKYALDATQIFERVAKEGRKYGLFLLLASQRPSELSRTVLSQCSNFIVHRIQNPEDLEHIRQMTPFISESVLSRLPSLPKQHALLFGNAVNVPTTFKVRDACPTPHSDDASISASWYRPATWQEECAALIGPL